MFGASGHEAAGVAQKLRRNCVPRSPPASGYQLQVFLRTMLPVAGSAVEQLGLKAWL